MKNKVSTYIVNTGCGQVHDPSELPFLNEKEFKEFNLIGYTGKDSAGNKTNWEKYLDSLGKGTFNVTQTRWDNGDFSEEFVISRAEEQQENPLDAYSIQELEYAILIKRGQEVQKEKMEKLKANFGVSEEEFERLVSSSYDIDWSNIGKYPWFVIYENEDGEVYGQDATYELEVVEIIEENVIDGCETLYVLKEGVQWPFSATIKVQVGQGV